MRFQTRLASAEPRNPTMLVLFPTVVLVPPRINVDAFLRTCRGSTSSSGGSQSVQLQPPPGHNNNNNNDTCTYLGVQRYAGQYLVGPTHTCLCTYGGVWTQCRPK